ncbi:hypothetical protein GMSM_45840 [Geomonas sp. Red276]
MLIEHWHPVTKDMGIINAPVKEVVSELVAWHASLGMKYTQKNIVTCFADALDALSPLSMEKRRRLFVATKSGWTACFQSGIAGSDPSPAMSVLSKRLGVLAMRICCTPTDAKWPGNIWEVYASPVSGGGQPLSYRRTIAAVNDGGRWVFEEAGPRFPFEKFDRYKLPRKRDRFTRDLLIEYLEQFGISPLSDDFYDVSKLCPAVMLENLTRWPKPPPEFTLEEAKTGLPWKHGG